MAGRNFIVYDQATGGNRMEHPDLLSKIRLAIEAVLLRQDVFQQLQGQDNIWTPNPSVFEDLAETLALFRQATERILAAA